jgi:hypothetical protein
VPCRYIENSIPKAPVRHRACRWKKPLMIGCVLLMLPPASVPGAAREDGRDANSP